MLPKGFQHIVSCFNALSNLNLYRSHVKKLKYNGKFDSACEGQKNPMLEVSVTPIWSSGVVIKGSWSACGMHVELSESSALLHFSWESNVTVFCHGFCALFEGHRTCRHVSHSPNPTFLLIATTLWLRFSYFISSGVMIRDFSAKRLLERNTLFSFQWLIFSYWIIVFLMHNVMICVFALEPHDSYAHEYKHLFSRRSWLWELRKF